MAQYMDSQIRTGNLLIPLAQFLSGSHIARNRDMGVLNCRGSTRSHSRLGSERKPEVASPSLCTGLLLNYVTSVVPVMSITIYKSLKNTVRLPLTEMKVEMQSDRDSSSHCVENLIFYTEQA